MTPPHRHHPPHPTEQLTGSVSASRSTATTPLLRLRVKARGYRGLVTVVAPRRPSHRRIHRVPGLLVTINDGLQFKQPTSTWSRPVRLKVSRSISAPHDQGIGPHFAKSWSGLLASRSLMLLNHPRRLTNSWHRAKKQTARRRGMG